MTESKSQRETREGAEALAQLAQWGYLALCVEFVRKAWELQGILVPPNNRQLSRKSKD